MSGEDGSLEFSDLPHGDYVLVETETPDGYELPEDNLDGKTPVTLCYTTKYCAGLCCDGVEVCDLSSCDAHPNSACNSASIQIMNERGEIEWKLPVYKLITLLLRAS